MQRLFVALGFAISISACGDGGGSSLPTSPSPTPPIANAPRPPAPGAAALTPGSISGLVFEATPAGPTPVENVELYCDACGEFGHTFAHTDVNGLYSFTGGVWLSPGYPTTIVRVLKDGYQDPPDLGPRAPLTPAGPGWREVRVDGDTRFDFELVRR